jgi:hypothetical protein
VLRHSRNLHLQDIAEVANTKALLLIYEQQDFHPHFITGQLDYFTEIPEIRTETE